MREGGAGLAISDQGRIKDAGVRVWAGRPFCRGSDKACRYGRGNRGLDAVARLRRIERVVPPPDLRADGREGEVPRNPRTKDRQWLR